MPVVDLNRAPFFAVGNIAYLKQQIVGKSAQDNGTVAAYTLHLATEKIIVELSIGERAVGGDMNLRYLGQQPVDMGTVVAHESPFGAPCAELFGFARIACGNHMYTHAHRQIAFGSVGADFPVRIAPVLTGVFRVIIGIGQMVAAEMDNTVAFQAGRFVVVVIFAYAPTAETVVGVNAEIVDVDDGERFELYRLGAIEESHTCAGIVQVGQRVAVGVADKVVDTLVIAVHQYAVILIVEVEGYGVVALFPLLARYAHWLAPRTDELTGLDGVIRYSVVVGVGGAVLPDAGHGHPQRASLFAWNRSVMPDGR